MISLIPCYSLEDFSLYRKASDVDEIFSAWSALYHPALVAHFDRAPKWEPAGSPSSDSSRKLIVVPPCAEYMAPRTWLKDAEANGAVVIRHVVDRDAILAEAFDRLGIDPRPKALAEQDVDPRPVDPQTGKPTLPYDDGAESLLSVGLCCLLEELLTRKLRYMSNLDQVSFNTRILEAARAHMSGDVEEREKAIQKAFDLLTQAKEYFFPTATKFLDLTWTHKEDLKDELPKMLRERRTRNEKTNLVLPAPVLEACQKDFPDTLALLREEVEAKRATILGGDEFEAPLYLFSPIEIARALARGRRIYKRLLGVEPGVFARAEAGYAQILPQLLKLSGWKGALSRTEDGWSILAKATDRSLFRWQGRDGSCLPVICKRPLDATSAEEIVQMPDRIGNSYYSDDASAIVFEHRPGKETRWLRDLLRMDRYSPTLGKFYDVGEYLRVSEGAGDKEKFVKDDFKTNFLTRSGKRSRKDLVSRWPLRRRLGIALANLSTLETAARIFAEARGVEGENVERQARDFISKCGALRDRVDAALQSLDAALMPVEATDDDGDFTAIVDELERQLRDALDALAAILNANGDAARGDLILNVSSTRQRALWEARCEGDEQIAVDAQARIREKVDAIPGAKVEIFPQPNETTTRVALELPPGAALWLENNVQIERRFLQRPLFATDAPAPEFAPLGVDQQNAERRETANRAPKKSFLKRFADSFRDARNAAANDEEDSTALAEYVEWRHSDTEVDRFYRLRNEYLELRVDPTTGSMRKLRTATSAQLRTGVLRQPTLGNRFAFDVTMRLPAEARKKDARPTENAYYGRAVPAADDFEILSNGGGVAALRVKGRLMTPEGELAAKFTQTISLQMRRRIVDLDLELEPVLMPKGAPWDSYYAQRFAWRDEMAEISGGVGAALIRTGRDYLQAPEAVDVRSDEDYGVTILSCGLPFFKRDENERMDAVLIPQGETRKRFHFAIGVDLDDPHATALSYADAPAIVLRDVADPSVAPFPVARSRRSNVLVLEAAPIVENERLVGEKLTLLETHGSKTTAKIRCAKELASVETFDFTGEKLGETLEFNGGEFVAPMKARQVRIVEARFKSDDAAE